MNKKLFIFALSGALVVGAGSAAVIKGNQFSRSAMASTTHTITFDKNNKYTVTTDCGNEASLSLSDTFDSRETAGDYFLCYLDESGVTITIPYTFKKVLSVSIQYGTTTYKQITGYTEAWLTKTSGYEEDANDIRVRDNSTYKNGMSITLDFSTKSYVEGGWAVQLWSGYNSVTYIDYISVTYEC